MLKLVVSDLDGTLINGQGELTPDVFKMIEDLREKGILFAVASGRKVCELRRIFDYVKDDVVFIACDGTFVMQRDKIVLKEVIEKEIIHNSFDRFGIERELISDVFGDTVKIVVRKEKMTDRAEEYIKINRLLSCVYEDSSIKEYVKFGRNKGTALKQLLKLFNIDKKDVVAFGDNYNDAEMLKLIPKSYAMKTGKAEIKRLCKYQTENVCETVNKLLENQGGF